MDLLTAFALLLIGFIVWLLSTLSAGGGAIVALPVLHLVIPIHAIAPSLCLASVIASAQRIKLYKQRINWSILGWLMPGIITGAALGGWLFSRIEAEWLSLLIAAFLLHHVYKQYTHRTRKSFPMRGWYFAPAGFVTAVLSGIVGAAGPILNPFYINANIVKEEMVATKAVSTFVMQNVKLVTYIVTGIMSLHYWQYGLVLTCGALLGNYVGKRYLKDMHLDHFHHWVNAVLFISAALILWRYFSI